jgi:hypothetical protein
MQLLNLRNGLLKIKTYAKRRKTMKNKTFLKGIISLALVMGMLLVISCGDGNNDKNNTPTSFSNESVKLASDGTTPYAGPAVDIDLWIDGVKYGKVGAINASLKLSITLPATLIDSLLSPEGAFLIGEAEFKTPALKELFFVHGVLHDEGRYAYFNKAGELNGYNYKKGWNLVDTTYPHPPIDSISGYNWYIEP